MNGPLRVLVVDDEEAVRLNLAAYLEDEGMAVSAAASGEEALALLPAARPQVAVVDMRLRGMDGNAFIAAAHRRDPALRFLVFTGSLDYVLPEELQAIPLTEAQVFHKPVRDMGLLVRAIEALAEGRGDG